MVTAQFGPDPGRWRQELQRAEEYLRRARSDPTFGNLPAVKASLGNVGSNVSNLKAALRSVPKEKPVEQGSVVLPGGLSPPSGGNLGTALDAAARLSPSMAGIIGASVLGAAAAGTAVAVRKRKRRKSRSTSGRARRRKTKRRKRRPAKKRRHKTRRSKSFGTEAQFKRRGGHKVFYTKKGQPYIKLKSGQARFIKRS